MKSYKFSLSVLLIATGVAGRFLLVEYVGIPNLEVITAIALIAGIFLGGKYSVIVPLVTIFLSDAAIGNTGILVFTWSAFAIIGLLGSLFGKSSIDISAKRSVFMAFVCSLFFFLYTNFGWWLMSGMYEYSLGGLVKCYVAAIPFFRNNLIGNLIFVPTSIYLFSALKCYLKRNSAFLPVFARNK